MDDLYKSIPDYNGDDDFDIWVTKVEKIFKLAKIDDVNLQGLRVLPHLKGKASKVAAASDNFSWADIKARLHAKFVDALNTGDFIHSLSNLSFSDEVDDFFDDVKRLSARAKLSDEAAIGIILNKLDPDIQRWIVLHNIKKLDDVHNALTRVKNSLKGDKVNNTFSPNRNSFSPRGNANRGTGRSSFPNKVSCFYCGLPGHIQSQCSIKMRASRIRGRSRGRRGRGRLPDKINAVSNVPLEDNTDNFLNKSDDSI